MEVRLICGLLYHTTDKELRELRLATALKFSKLPSNCQKYSCPWRLASSLLTYIFFVTIPFILCCNVPKNTENAVTLVEQEKLTQGNNKHISYYHLKTADQFVTSAVMSYPEALRNSNNKSISNAKQVCLPL